jgi:hypothetical protein
MTGTGKTITRDEIAKPVARLLKAKAPAARFGGIRH